MLRKLWHALRPWPRHPIDRQYGIETSAKVARVLLRTGDARADQSSIGYVGSQPSIIRRALAAIPGITGATFFDLGCGKGRALVVATEYPFSQIIGLELAPRLARSSQRNMAKVAEAHPERTRASVRCADATRPELPPSGLVVLYLYNPFRADLMGVLLEHVAARLGRSPDLKVFVVYYNPTHAALLDAHPTFQRYLAERVEFSEEERGSSPFKSNFDSVAVWQSLGGTMTPPRPDADREIRVTTPDLAAHVF